MSRPKDRTYISISESLDLVTSVDKPKVGENYFQRLFGFWNSREMVVAERDYGTKQKYHEYPEGIIVNGTILYNSNTGDYYEVLAVIDTTLKIYVYDGSWIDVTPTADWYEGNVGNNPHIRWYPIEAQSKVVMVYGSSDVHPVMRQPIVIQKHAQRSRFGETIVAGWYTERHQLIPNLATIPTEQSMGDLSWDAISYFYGQVPTGTSDKEHVITNSGIDSIEVTSVQLIDVGLWADTTPMFEIIDLASPLPTLEPGQTLKVKVRANHNPDNPDPFQWAVQDVTLRASAGADSVDKNLGASFKEDVE